jgi:hypothetical protein
LRYDTRATAYKILLLAACRICLLPIQLVPDIKNIQARRNKTGGVMSKAWYYLLAVLMVLLVGNKLFLMYLNKTYPKEEIEAAFEPITTKYGIKIEYEIGDDFFSPLKNTPIPAGPHRGSKVKPIRHSVLMRYPDILQRAFSKYPVGVIKFYLSGIHFAGEIDQAGFKFSGSYDPFRRIVYLVDDGENTDEAISTFHHEFSSLLVSSNSFAVDAWTNQNPKDFKYLGDVLDTWEAANKVIQSVKDIECFEKGIVSGYGLTNYGNDFSEYSAMIMTYPEKFKKIMDKYPRVRGKFLIWQKFYQEIEPIFTEDYLFGKSEITDKK